MSTTLIIIKQPIQFFIDFIYRHNLSLDIWFDVQYFLGQSNWETATGTSIEHPKIFGYDLHWECKNITIFFKDFIEILSDIEEYILKPNLNTILSHINPGEGRNFIKIFFYQHKV